MAIITLITDFGLTDHFVGAMKGVILSIAPRVTIVDITHHIGAYGISEAAFVLAQSWSYFPRGTIHVTVVDPGVGSDRRPILAEAGGHYFIAPDNGVLSMVYDAAKHKVRVISNTKTMLKQVSRTFHGRDIFAPAAAHLAKGLQPDRFGKLITDYVRSPHSKPAHLARHTWAATILKVDRFGNLITNLHIDHFAEVKRRAFEIRVGDTKIRRLALTYAETAPREVFLIVGSSGYLEIAANQASAAEMLNCGAGSTVEFELFYD